LFPLQSVPRTLLRNGHSTMLRQRFLWGPVPGYTTRVFREPSSVSAWMVSDAMCSAVTRIVLARDARRVVTVIAELL
jgi:hypothetical protein